MHFAKFAALALTSVALATMRATPQHRNATAGAVGAMDLTPDLNILILASILALLRPLSLNTKTSKGIEEKFGPTVTRILRSQCQIQIQTALYQLGQCTRCNEIQMPDPTLAQADESLSKVQPGDGTGSNTGGAAASTGGVAPLPVPLPVPAPALPGIPL